MQHIDTQHIVGGVSTPLAPKKSRHVFEKEIKNKVAQVIFAKPGCTDIIGRINFSVAKYKQSRRDEQRISFKDDTHDNEYFLWVKSKREGGRNIFELLAQLIQTIGKIKHLKPTCQQNSFRYSTYFCD